jgi:hypothetical protein
MIPHREASKAKQTLFFRTKKQDFVFIMTFTKQVLFSHSKNKTIPAFSPEWFTLPLAEKEGFEPPFRR